MPTRYPSPLLTGGSGFLQGFSSILTQGLLANAQEESARQAALRETIIKAVTQKPELLDDPETQKLLTKGIPKETQPVFLNLLRAIGQGGPFEQASRSERAAFQGATTAPPEGGPTMPAGEFLQRETPAGAALLVGDKRAYLTAREKETAGTGEPELTKLYRLKDQAKTPEERAGYQARIESLTTTPTERADIQEQARVRTEQRRARLQEQQMHARFQQQLDKPFYALPRANNNTTWGKLRADGTVDASQHPSPDMSPRQARSEGYAPIDAKEAGALASFFGFGTTSRTAAPAPAEPAAPTPAGVPAGPGWSWVPAHE